MKGMTKEQQIEFHTFCLKWLEKVYGIPPTRADNWKCCAAALKALCNTAATGEYFREARAAITGEIQKRRETQQYLTGVLFLRAFPAATDAQVRLELKRLPKGATHRKETIASMRRDAASSKLSTIEAMNAFRVARTDPNAQLKQETLLPDFYPATISH